MTMTTKLFSFPLWKYYVVVRWTRGPIKPTGILEIELGLRRWY